jgi:hypothetical protein
VLLSAASQREDHGIELAPNLKGGPAQKVVRKLLSEGLIEEVRASGSLPKPASTGGYRSVSMPVVRFA